MTPSTLLEQEPATLTPQQTQQPCRAAVMWLVLAAWLALATVMTLLALQNLTAPGINYDEAVYGHLAEDFLLGRHCAQHMPGSQIVNLFGRPFPLFVQGYLGAVKCWMLMPGYALFGSSVAVTRLTMLAWGLLGVLCFMLGVARLLDWRAAILGGCLLGLDPAFFHTTVCEWGGVVPSYVCRLAGFCFIAAWWRKRRPIPLFLAGLALGLGFLHKIDFIVILGGCGLALLAIYRSEVLDAARSARSRLVLVGIGFVVGASPAILKLPETIRLVLSGGANSSPNELREKLNTAWAMFDGSYFYRLMEHGGVFTRMYDTPRTVCSPYGLVFAISVLLLAGLLLRSWRKGTPARLPAFLLLSTVLVLLGTWLMPGAIRLHHWTLVYPLPHLIIVYAALWAWKHAPLARVGCWAVRGLTVAAAAGVFVGNVLAIQHTQLLVSKTGGSGWWASALDQYAAEIRTRSDLTVICYDWGFYEQLALLTDGPRLVEPIWQIAAGKPLPFAAETNVVYLMHPPDYRLFPFSTQLLQAAYSTNGRKLDIQEHKDRAGQTAFLSMSFH